MDSCSAIVQESRNWTKCTAMHVDHQTITLTIAESQRVILLFMGEQREH
jgi:hypothetical protein